MGLRGVREGMGKVYVHVRCHGHGHRSVPALRTGRTAAFAESVQYQFDDLDEQQLLGLQVFEDVGGADGQLLLTLTPTLILTLTLTLTLNPNQASSC